MAIVLYLKHTYIWPESWQIWFGRWEEEILTTAGYISVCIVQWRPCGWGRALCEQLCEQCGCMCAGVHARSGWEALRAAAAVGADQGWLYNSIGDLWAVVLRMRGGRDQARQRFTLILFGMAWNVGQCVWEYVSVCVLQRLKGRLLYVWWWHNCRSTLIQATELSICLHIYPLWHHVAWRRCRSCIVFVCSSKTGLVWF